MIECLIQLFCSWRFDRNLFAMRTPELSLTLNVHEIIVNEMQIYTVLNIEANRNLSFLSFARQTTWDNLEMIAETQSYIFGR